MPLFWACCAQYLVSTQVAQLATTTVPQVAQLATTTFATSLVPDTHSYLLAFFAIVVPLFWTCCAQYLVLVQVAQLATTTCATNFVSLWHKCIASVSGCR